MMLSLTTRLQMWIDYLKYVIILQKGESINLGVELFFFILSVYLFIQDVFTNPGGHAISIIFLFVIIQFLRDINGTKNEVNSYFNIQHSILRDPSNIADLKPSPKERKEEFESIFVDSKKVEKVFVSNKINRYIQTTPLTINLTNKKKKKIREYLEKHKDVLLQYLNYYFFSSLKKHREFVNNEKFCMSSDINLNSKSVECHTGGYFDSFLTNQISGTTLIIKDAKHTTISTEEIFPSGIDEENNAYLTDISSSSMNHHVGCSTLGFTKDNNFVIWIQSNTNQFSSGLLIPTGSGSANASDVMDNNFQKTIIYTMERELKEESSINKSPSGQYKTMILGFYRWVSRGGKPEFVGITKLPENANYYQPNTKEVMVKKTKNNLFHLQTIDKIPDFLADIRKRGKLSVPLFMCLRELEYMYAYHKIELEKFLFNETQLPSNKNS